MRGEGSLLSDPAPGRPGASTQVAAVIGWPVRHSVSPAMHNAAFDALGLDWVYVALEVDPAEVGRAFDGVRVLGFGGLSVTMPHKAAALAAVDDATPAALAIGAVNTVVRRRDGSLLGHNTDGAGFLASLSEEGFEPDGRSCLVVGGGGAARAVVHALASAGAGEVVVVNRSPDRADATASLAGAVGRVGSAGDAASADLVVNATPLGLAGSGAASLPLDPGLLGSSQFVVDLVPNPAVTAFMEAARARGATAVGGLGMLVHQGALAFELWTGRQAPVEVMRDAARRALA